MRPKIVLGILKAHYEKSSTESHIRKLKVPALEIAEVRECIREMEYLERRGKLRSNGARYYARALDIANKLIMLRK